jgi:formate--tetrahydrofolate ligase
MVTAMTPTKAGEGKTTTAIGLADALSRRGEKAVVALREPSLGPVFGMKGGATGGGRARVVPGTDINLHFTGDIHAVSTAHNLLAAMADNRLHFDGAAGPLNPRGVVWKRVVDMNDRALREIVLGLGGPANGVPRESGYDISTASEIMAILCLAENLPDLKARLGSIVVGTGPAGTPVFARDLKADGALTALLRDALEPNLVQTLEGTPALVHGGPFANIAHGTNSIIATRLGLERANYVVTESGFGADLGAEKFFDIVVRTGRVPSPAACVLVATLRALKLHGGVDAKQAPAEDVAAVERGFDNVRAHLEILRAFGVPFVVALNLFPTDTPAEVAAFEALCRSEQARFAPSDVFARGGEGGADLAREVLAAIAVDPGDFRFAYPSDLPLTGKIEAVAVKIYGARGVAFKTKARKKLEDYERWGFGRLPICVAKTQYSLSDNDQLLNRPRDFTLTVTDAGLSAGAGFVIVHCGDVLTMPGLPKAPAAENVDVAEDGEIIGVS